MPTASPALRSCYIPVLIYTPAVLARARGYYQALGLDVRLERLATGANLMPFTLNGTLDVTIGGAGSDYFNALAAGHELRLLAPFHAERPPAVTPLLVRADLHASGAVRKVADLRGRPVSAPTPGAPLYWLASALESGGLTVRDVDLRYVGYGDVGAAFERGELDGALLGEPLVSDLVARGLAVRLADDFVDGLQPTYLYCLRSVLDERRTDIVRFVAGQLRVYADLASGDPARAWDAPDTLAVITDFTDVPSARIAAAQRPFYDPRGRFQPESLERLYRFFVDNGYVEPLPTFDPAALIDPTIVPEALALLEQGDDA